jgi:D-alanyl-D-alanine carboxypeptidase/D-alanyl-D-alanine-endopeptidase (penicillin-binding protein 4)
VRAAGALRALPVVMGFAITVGAVPPTQQASPAQVDRLGAELRSILGGARWSSAKWGALVVSLDRGDTLFAVNADSALAPASNLKLLTTAAALEELGPGYRFRTYLLTDGSVRNGVLEGNLVLYGTGDPGISDRFYPSKNTVFHSLVDQLAAAGIRSVLGDLVADASFLTGPLRPEGWDPDDLNDHFAAPISALSFNENVVSLRIEAAPQTGSSPVVHSLPDHAELDVVNEATTVAGRGRVTISREDPLDPILVQGRIARGARDVWRQLTVPDPARFTLAVFASVLEDRGIRISGRRRLVSNPGGSVASPRVTAPVASPRPRTRILATHVSPPLRDYLAVVNKRSNNLFAELLFRAVGRHAEGAASPQAAERTVRRTLAGMGVDTAGIVLMDGSGLSGGNRVPAKVLVGLLSQMSKSELWGDLWASLPEAGNRRELPRMYRTPAAGNLRAKTGTIEGVSALSGVVQSMDGERLAFSIMVNESPSQNGAKRIEDELGVRLASFVRGPDADVTPLVTQLPPPPPSSDPGGPVRHQVLPGESFDVIARRYGVGLEELLAANPSVEPRRLKAGSWVVVPPGSKGSGARGPGGR